VINPIQSTRGTVRNELRRRKEYICSVSRGTRKDEGHENHNPTVNDSPHPQASWILGFLKENLALNDYHCVSNKTQIYDLGNIP
jgi:hypothetical protein